MNFETCSEEETQAFGTVLGRSIDQAVTILLEGDLGVGKSVVARGLARGLDVPGEVPITSPTFTLMNHYPARLDLYHFDLYRLSDAEELVEIGFDDFAHNQGVALVEWPERLDDRTFDHLEIRIVRVDTHRRGFSLRAQGEVATRLLECLEAGDWSS